MIKLAEHAKEIAWILLFCFSQVLPLEIRKELNENITDAYQQCSSPAIQARYDVLDRGFHRRVRLDLLWPEGVRKGDSFIVVYPVTRDVYIDLDQIAANESIKLISGAEIDTELPAHLSSNHTVLIFGEFSSQSSIVEFPVHFRYQPSSLVMHHTVDLPLPTVYVKGVDCSHDVKQLPCTVSSSSLCSWMCMKLVRLCSADERTHCQETIKISIPCGSRDHLLLVVAATVLASVLGTLYLLWQLCML